MQQLHASPASERGPLHGIKVLELGRFITAPYAARLLADLGADVVKVEDMSGDPFRVFTGDEVMGPYFIAFNRNKRSLCADISHPRGQEIIRRCAMSADIFIQNSRPGALARFGLDHEALLRAHPSLIYCSITGMGLDGPDAARPAYDLVGQALSGLTSLSAEPQNPQPLGTTVADSVTGMTACNAVLAALIARLRTGNGQHVMTDMLSSTLAFIGAEAQIYLQSGEIPDAYTRAANSLAFLLRARDGDLVGIHLSSLDKFWKGLLRVTNDAKLARDPRFTTRATRTKNYLALRDSLQEIFVRHTAQEWLTALADEDVPSAPVNDLAEVFANRQVRHLGMLATMSHPELGLYKTVGLPFSFGQTSPPSMLAPPLLGEHTRQVLSETGFSDSDIDGFINDQIVRHYTNEFPQSGEEVLR